MPETQGKATGGTLEVPARRAMIEPTAELVDQAYAAIHDGTMPPEVGDPEVTRRAIMERIRHADSFDQVFSPSSLTPWSQYAGEVVTVYGFHLNPSAFKEQQSAVYAVVEISRDGDPDNVEMVSTGGGNVLTQLVKAWENGWFPFRATLVVKPTASGRETQWIEAAPKA